MKDFYGELVSILTVTIAHRQYILFRGDWYDHEHVRAHDRSKVYYVRTHDHVENNKNPFTAPDQVSGQVWVARHPFLVETSVIFDRTADFLECESSEDDAHEDEEAEAGRTMPEAPTSTRTIGQEYLSSDDSDAEPEPEADPDDIFDGLPVD